jgi:hypothetical protein
VNIEFSGCQKVETPLKFKQDLNWSLFLNFIIKILERFGSWTKKENCSI